MHKLEGETWYMKKYFAFYLLAIVITQQIDAQLLVKYKELNQYALEARDSKLNCFVVYSDGDSVKGKNFIKKRNMISGKSKWTIDGKSIEVNDVLIYQDENAYVYCYPFNEDNFMYGRIYGTEFGRLYKGKISLFSSQVSQTSIDRRTDNRRTYFFLSTDQTKFSNMSPVTPKQLEDMIKDHPAAVEKLKQEFNKIHDKETNEYNRIIAVLKVYNDKK
jgi:hypothetical protein